MDNSLASIATVHQMHIERLKAGDVRKFDAFLMQMDKDLREMLTRADITQFSKSRLESQLMAVDAMIRRNLSDYEKAWRSSMVEFASYESDFEKRSLENVIKGLNVTLPTEAALLAAALDTPVNAFAGKTLNAVFKNYTEAEAAKITGAIRLGYAEGLTNQQIIQRVRGTVAAKFRDGTLAQVKSATETLVRTSVQHVANQSRQALWEANEDIVEKVEWLSTLDSRTSTQCRSLDGIEWPIDKGPRPPIHPRCRSTTVAVLAKEYQKFIDDGVRPAKDPDSGKVSRISANTSYYDWLKRQPVDVQESIIGTSRARLLRNGGLSSERFAELQLGKQFEPLNLEQMRELDPVAFSRAGI